MAGLSSAFESFKTVIANKYGKDAGKMLIHTGIIGWVMSSAAQIAAIVINDKIPKEQKMFMIPQEFADAIINILSFYCVTNTFKSVAGKLVKNGKWIRKDIKTFLEKNNLAEGLGKKGFDVKKVLEKNGQTELLEKFNDTGAGIDVLSTIAGTVLSCNLITPVGRNIYASYRQKDGLDRIAKRSELKKETVGIQRPLMADFQAGRTSSGDLKI